MNFARITRSLGNCFRSTSRDEVRRVSRRWAWDLRSADGSVVTRQLTFEDNGDVCGSCDVNFQKWRFDYSDIVITGADGRMKYRFALGNREYSDASIIKGVAEQDGREPYYLVRATNYAQRPTSGVHLKKLRNRRKNLVLIRANQESMHALWRQNIQPDERNWDLCLSWYGTAESFKRRPKSEYAVLQNKSRKFTSIYDLCHEQSIVFEYDYVAFFDDDIDTNWKDINELFEIAQSRDLFLSQPSLSPDSFICHEITRQVPENLLRYTNYVEVMCPIFSKRALELCAGTFKLSDSAWGLDYVWPKILNEHRKRIAVIDAIAVKHTRPVAGGYDISTANVELLNIIEIYNINFQFSEFEAIRAI